MKKELESLPPLSSVCCIYRVSERLRLANAVVYTPQVVSIGPLHHGKESLKAMEDHKKRYLKTFLQRTNLSLEYYINIVRAKEARLRDSYAEPIKFGSDEFVKMVLVDAAFVTEILLRNCLDEFQDERGHSIFNKPWILQDVFPDLLLLENQLPFFILEDLLNTVPYDATKTLSITELCHKFFFAMIDFHREWDSLENIYSSKVLHFVDFLRKIHVPPSKDLHAGGRLKTPTIPSVSELIQCGVRVKLGSTTSLFDIHFSNGVLEIPMGCINFVTEMILRNILAFEQRHCRETYINDYLVLMNRLISTPEDVGFLVKHGVIENKLGDIIEVSSLAKKLADGVIMKSNDFYFATVCEELNAYCRIPWNAWKANLKQNYFNTPWAIVSVIAASLLIVLTIMQTVCSVLSVNNKN